MFVHLFFLFYFLDIFHAEKSRHSLAIQVSRPYFDWVKEFKFHSFANRKQGTILSETFTRIKIPFCTKFFHFHNTRYGIFLFEWLWLRTSSLRLFGWFVLMEGAWKCISSEAIHRTTIYVKRDSAWNLCVWFQRISNTDKYIWFCIYVFFSDIFDEYQLWKQKLARRAACRSLVVCSGIHFLTSADQQHVITLVIIVSSASSKTQKAYQYYGS